MSKGKELLPKIIEASNNTEAISVLHDILEVLHLSDNYTNLVKIRDELQEEKQNFISITNAYNNADQDIETMMQFRKNMNFLYRDITDKFSYVVNKNKIYFEEEKTAVRAKAMENLKNNKEAQEIFKTKSTSGLRDIVGFDNAYQEYISNAGISYGLYQELSSVLNSIRMYIDLVASQIKHEQLILQKDVK
jgi:hypothetical protein